MAGSGPRVPVEQVVVEGIVAVAVVRELTVVVINLGVVSVVLVAINEQW